jgi:hypothetical protein
MKKFKSESRNLSESMNWPFPEPPIAPYLIDREPDTFSASVISLCFGQQSSGKIVLQ